MLRSALTGLCCCLLVAVSAFAQTRMVTLKDGRKITGNVTKTEAGWEIQTEFGTLVYPASEVISVEDIVTPQEKYKQRLLQIDPNDPQAHYELAKWALDEDLLEIAKKELQTAMKLKPGTEKHSLLLRQVEARIRKQRPPRTIPRTTATTPTSVVPAARLRPEWLCSDEDISRVRLEELLDPNDVVLISFRNKVRERFLEEMLGDEDFRRQEFAGEFYRRSPTRQAIGILDRIDRDNVAIKDDIVVKSDPKSLSHFRNRVWPIVARSCAASDCHGGGDKPVGGLRLFRVPGRSDKVDYTNFLILDGFVRGNKRMIDRGHPGQSLLLQFGLPAELAERRHPTVIPPVFQNEDVLNYRTVRQWIESLAGPPHPDYRLRYRPPLGMNLDWRGAEPDAPDSSPVETGPGEQARPSP